MKKFHTLFGSVFLFGLSITCHAQGHTHGEAELFVAQEGDNWLLQFVIPAEDALGFESEAETDEQKTRVSSLISDIESNTGIVEIANKCALTDVSHSLETHDEHEHGHHNVEIEYAFSCKVTASSISLLIFDTMPSLESIHVEWIKENGQGSVILNKENNTVTW
ncbi:DUF2796 domain-containing protein [Alteromonas sp. 5E99-2]|uniref:ZrgA family zinc uptake protein n=1 Tax=Alteromonas sp. 5E99-2 TaxID=2817683 RepID=UPI001A9940AE|nr:DUF2796 domain-containing protein [Alteromonas sp. 5E99-2]MBO1255015.1 DUF2796 domain-containing protein [Alteromonas sp. 5E99-2]